MPVLSKDFLGIQFCAAKNSQQSFVSLSLFIFSQMYRCIRILNDSLRSLSRILPHFFFKKQVQNNFTRETTGTFFCKQVLHICRGGNYSRKENSLKFLCIFPPKIEAHRLTSVKKSSLLMLKTTAFHSLDIVTIYTKVCFHCESRTFQKDIYNGQQVNVPNQVHLWIFQITKDSSKIVKL